MQERRENIWLKIEAKRVETLYDQSIRAQVSGILNMLIFWFVTRDYVAAPKLYVWLGIAIFINVTRICFQKFFVAKFIRSKKFEPALWERIFTVGTFLAGAVWGIAGTWLLPHGVLAQHAFLGFILAGNSAGAAVAYCSSIWASQAYLLPSTVPYIFAMAAEGDKFHVMMALCVVLFDLLLSILIVRMNKFVVDGMELHYVNDDLLSEIRETQGKIAQTAKMVALGEMSGGVAHEINTPLSVITLEVEGLRELCRKRDLQEVNVLSFAERIESMVTRISKTINHLRSFARESSRDQATVIAVRDIVSTTLEFCRGRIESQGVTVEVGEIAENLRVLAHNFKIVQALLNVLNNAFEATTKVPGGKVAVTASENDHYVQISVADNGRGIPEAIREKVMQPFFTTKELGDGPGLGLSVALGIVQAHDGKLDFTTSERGTTFTFSLPKNEAKLQSA